MRDYTTSIVIPIYKNWHLCHGLLNDLWKHEKENIDYVIVANDSPEDPEVEGGLSFWKQSNLLPIMEVVVGDGLNGFTANSNRGLKLFDRAPATKHIDFLISSDVSISGKFVEKTADILFGARKCFVGGKLLTFDTGWNTFDGITFQYLEGWFLACTSDGWRELGYFDENYNPYDYEDIDISTTAKRKGYKLTPLNSPFIKHLGAGTIGYNSEREKITFRNREYFKKKWVK